MSTFSASKIEFFNSANKATGNVMPDEVDAFSSPLCGAENILRSMK